MKVALSWQSAVRQLRGAGRAIARFFGPFAPVEPGARFTPGFRVHASYARFVFSLHALAPRQEPLCQADVHDAIKGSDVHRTDWPARHPGEMASIANASRRPSSNSKRHSTSARSSR